MRKLLIIDDDKPVRHSISAFLEDSGYGVIEAVDGPAGLERFEQGDIDLVITDLRMPGMDGVSVLRQLRERSCDIPVIVISGAGVMSDVVSALRLGACDYLIKPIVDMEVLEHSIEKALERQDLLAENKRYRDELESANRGLRENLRVLERDQAAGRQVQRRLLPQPQTTVEGYSVAHHIAPSLYLSGDFVDYAHISKRYLAFYLADVSGHGASSAFVTIWLKHLVSRMVREEGLFADHDSFESGANTMLEYINRELNEISLNHHLTFFVGVIDTHTHDMRYVVAGHLPMPVLIRDGKAEYLTGRGKPVGIFKDISWHIHAMTLPEQFSLVCFSDGVLEILPDDSLQKKEAHLLELIAQKAQNLETVCDALNIKDVSETPDDIAVLTITRGF
ncbi:SpoIIE family protein phosphatase [Gilvimarinus agarilyticus]|uniref:SpoIIE family protein phosphatase n=1 Tax=unclassified Gilvimarinus TaxID=2642066 RepID=UPI001C0A365C|nr:MULTISPECIES: SpoIIE family protein phosphatase [unclassified Gilvimarinus]MBU2885957.1 SpoIIE family protein phosphatase [Gilvimarinus agarilyticus]MDO6570703.1 SpoIIE family protein phosphatase [Gilvimarinus sp. 2_MG-2023]MDO6747704.1 SpoIIE family protein phosphatase [Gilvimarinus sp. 1_MG-2023]